jgi:hypothetical protein
VAYGELGRDNVATCSVRIRWGIHPSQHERLPGCGARIAVCHGCGLRTRINGARCEACGGEERPEVTRVHAREVLADGAHGRQEPEVVSVAVDAVDRAADVPRQDGNGARRETKEKAPSKPRAPRKAVKKGAATQDDPGMPLFK